MSHLVVGIGPGSTAEQRFTNRYRGVEPESMPPSSALSSQISCPHLDSTALDPLLAAHFEANPQIMAK